jgi:hypothetical protein
VYSHGKRVDTSQIPVVYIGARELRSSLKRILSESTPRVIGSKWWPRAVLLPVSFCPYGNAQKVRDGVAKLRRDFAAVIDRCFSVR